MSQWTSEEIAALRAQGRPFRLAFARQTPEEKAQQRDQMSASLNEEQLDHVLHLWEKLAIEAREMSTQMQALYESLALKVRQLQDQQ